MYHLRRRIRDGNRHDISVANGLRSAEYELQEDLELLMDEALQSKCPGNGQNLLMYAAAQANEDWFLHLVGDIRKRVRVHCEVHFFRFIKVRQVFFSNEKPSRPTYS